MKLAITADIHLTRTALNPERFHALENILAQMREAGVDTLIIAGDLFHAESRHFSELEKICTHPDNRHIAFHIIPGNHDANLQRGSFAADNIHVYAETTLQPFGEQDATLLFLPYKKETSMGEALAPFQEQLRNRDWILVAHGDWIDSMREPNPMEPGIYMPLLRTDIENTKPGQVFLGHIHKAFDRSNIHYPGSPCPLDINETGKRRYLIYDTTSGSVKSQAIPSDVIYFNEWLIVLPVENQRLFIHDKAAEMMSSWSVTDAEKKKIKLRLKVSGYTTNREELKKVLHEAFSGISFYSSDDPDLSDVSVADDIDRAAIVEQTSQRLESMEWFPNVDEPSRKKVFLQALKVIYEKR
jgi:DNA repair protein SbcD/Mre11